MAKGFPMDVHVGAKLTDFEKGMKKMQDTLTRIERKNTLSARRSGRAWQKFGAQFKTLFAGAGALAGMRAFQSALTRTVDEIDRMAKTADGLGMTIEHFSALAGIAGEAGVEQEKFAKGLAKLNKVITDAGDGLTTYVRAFERMGISIRDEQGFLKDTQTVFFQLKAAMDKTGASQANIASLMDIFGARIGKNMVRVLQDMGMSMEEVTERARELGVVIGENFAEKAQKAKNSWDLFSQSLLASSASVFAPLMDDMDWMLLKLREWVVEFTRAWEMGRDTANMSIEGMKRELEQLKGADAGSRTVAGGKSMTVEKRMSDLRGAISFRGLGGQVRVAMDRAADQRAQARTAAAETAGGRQKDLMAGVRKKLGIADPDDVFDYGEAESTLDGIRTREVEAAKKAAERKLKIERDREEENAALLQERAEAEMLHAEEAKERMVEMMVKEAAFAAEFESVMSDAFAGVIAGTHSVQDAFRSMMRAILNQIIQQSIAQPIAAGITGGASGLLGKLFGGGRVAPAAGTVISTFPGAAAGGPVQAGRPIMVGEHGREAFVPSQGGRVLSHPQTERALGGGGSQVVNLSFNIQSTDGPGVRRALNEAVPSIVNAAKGSLLEDMRRPSPVRQVMRGHA